MNEYVEQLKAEFEAGDVTVVIPLADAMNELDHPNGAELSELAVQIVTETDWSIVFMATCVFTELVKKEF